jgi:hypothetical protein
MVNPEASADRATAAGLSPCTGTAAVGRDRPRAELRLAYGCFARLVQIAENCAARGDDAAAAAVAQIAARHAFHRNAGVFASPRLERVLLRLGNALPAAHAAAPAQSGGHRRNVLHVLTYARPVGGDTRFVWRWIRLDGESRHSVAITCQADAQGQYEIPQSLHDAVREAGGQVHVLGAPTNRPLEQAVELRRLCHEADIVVLHVFPYDVVPIIALAAGCDATRTVFVNHADHAFWLGAGVCHGIAHLRRQSLAFLRDHRCLDTHRAAILPIPIDVPQVREPRAGSRDALGVGPDTVVLLTIASPFKYRAPGLIGFLDLVVPVLAAMPNTVLVAVGPEPAGEWRAAAERTGGRIRALGTRYDNDALYAAADIYLDSAPFSSITSLIEAGSRGLPLVGYRFEDPELELLCAGAPGIDTSMCFASGADAYRLLLVSLVNDRSLRERCGERARTVILGLHTGTGWYRCARDVYALVAASPVRGCLAAREPEFDEGALCAALQSLYGAPLDRRWMQRLIARFVGPLPYRLRVALTWRTWRAGTPLCVLALLPRSIEAAVRSAARRGRRVRARLTAPSSPARAAGTGAQGRPASRTAVGATTALRRP